jgi:serine/threonine-protein kinase PknG
MADTDPSDPSDPRSRLLADPRLPQRLRVCTRCGDPVGRARGGRAGLVEGFCAGCGQRYSLRPPLRAGDRVGDVEVVGALAHGGQGWLYLGRERSAGWVVLRPLAGDRRFLTEIDHPAIVRTHAFVERGATGYAVLDYVDGTPLRERLARRDTPPPTTTEMIDVVLAVLPALGHLHRRGLGYRGLTPEGIVLDTRGRILLVDVDAIHRLAPASAPVPAAADPPTIPTARSAGGSAGMAGMGAMAGGSEKAQAPAQVLAAGRLLGTLVGDAAGRHESLRRLLAKATAGEAARRYPDAELLEHALLGVRREVVAADGGAPVPGPVRGSRFGSDASPVGTGAPWEVLPTLLPDPRDPAAGALAALPDDLPPARLAGMLAALAVTSPSAQLRLADLRTRLGEHDAAQALLERVEADHPREWGVDWQRGLLLLAIHAHATGRDNGSGDGDGSRRSGSGSGSGGAAGSRARAAVRAFERVLDEAPGELAAQLALAYAGEQAGDAAGAARYYERVAVTDPTLTGAAFGLARLRAAAGDRDGAAAALRRVPASSPAGVAARTRLVRVLGTEAGTGSPPDVAGLAAASAVLADLDADLDPPAQAALVRDLLTGALALLTAGAIAPDPAVTVAGAPLRPAAVRAGLERAYRTLARHAATDRERHALVDLANGVRPRTLL